MRRPARCEAADELVQSACERALGRLDQFTPGTRLDSWMFRIIHTLWIDRMRYARRRPEASVKVDRAHAVRRAHSRAGSGQS